MRAAIDILMKEHRFIEEVMGSLETFALQLEQGASASAATVSEYGDFLKNYVDRTHHGKEEDRLFAKMIEYGFPREYGPIAVMLSEHVEGRSHVRALRDIGAGSGPLTIDEVKAIKEHTEMYVPLLANHIVKEDRILYPMALRAIPPEALDRLVAEYDAFESSVMGEGEHEQFHRLAALLIEAHPGVEDSGSMGCTGCH